MADTPYQHLYSKKAWQLLRGAILARDNWKCQRCGSFLVGGRKAPRSAVVNHKTPHKGNLALFYAPGNLEAVCKACHDSDIQREERSTKTQIGLDGWPVS